MTAARIARPWDGRIIAGVCAGLGLRTGVDANLYRAAFVLLAFASGVGVIVYALLWLFLPVAGDRRPDGLWSVARSNLERLGGELGFSRRKLGSIWKASDRSHQIAAIILFATGGLLLLWSVGALTWMTAPRLIGMAAIIAGLGVLLAARSTRR